MLMQKTNLKWKIASKKNSVLVNNNVNYNQRSIAVNFIQVTRLKSK